MHDQKKIIHLRRRLETLRCIMHTVHYNAGPWQDTNTPMLFALLSTSNRVEVRSELQVWTSSPGYGTLPLVTSSVSRMPNDHTSDLMVNFPYRAASGAVHFIGNLAPKSNRDALLQIFKQQMFNVNYKSHKSTLHFKSCFGSKSRLKNCSFLLIEYFTAGNWWALFFQ